MKRAIYITQKIIFNKDRNEYFDSLDTRYVKYFNQFDLPIISIPNDKKQINQILGFFKPALIVLTGGNDMKQFKIRDEIEKELIKFSIEKENPLLAICKGMQSVASFFNVKIKKISNHVNVNHKLFGEINGKRNSYHNYCIEKLPVDFKLLSKSTDNTIEAIKHKIYPIECWMWHPEREKVYNENDIKRIKSLLKK
jgi:gamma-glutamyl-gamma-aminobutyrate hydrolase PuuD